MTRTDNVLQCTRLPQNEAEKQDWINKIPSFRPCVNYRVCAQHWPQDAPMVKVKGGSFRPACPPTVFDVPRSCLPTSKPAARKAKVEFSTQAFFDSKDIFKSFDEFSPRKELCRKYSNVLFFSSHEKFVAVFMKEDFSESAAVISVLNKRTMCCPVTFSATKQGVHIMVPRTI